MQDHENLKSILKKVRQNEDFAMKSEEEVKPIINFLYELAKIENKIINYKNLSV